MLLPLAGLQVEECIDLFFLRLCIIEFQDIVVDAAGSGDCSSGRRLDAGSVAGVDGHFTGDIAGSTAFSWASCR